MAAGHKSRPCPASAGCQRRHVALSVGAPAARGSNKRLGLWREGVEVNRPAQAARAVPRRPCTVLHLYRFEEQRWQQRQVQLARLRVGHAEAVEQHLSLGAAHAAHRQAGEAGAAVPLHERARAHRQ